MFWSLISLLSVAKEVDFSNCESNDNLGISSFVLTPDHLVVEQETTVTVSGTATTEFSRVVMDLGVVVSSFYTHTIMSDYDACGNFMGGCPLESGDWTWERTAEIPDAGSLSYLVGVELTMKATFRDEDSTDISACIIFPMTIYETLPTAPPTKNPTNLRAHSSNSNELTELWIPIVAGVSAICLCCGWLTYRDHRRRKKWLKSCDLQMEGFTGPIDDTIIEKPYTL